MAETYCCRPDVETMKCKLDIRVKIDAPHLRQPEVSGSGSIRRFNSAVTVLPVMETIMGRVGPGGFYAFQPPWPGSPTLRSVSSGSESSGNPAPLDGERTVGLLKRLQGARKLTVLGPEMDIFRLMYSRIRLSRSIDSLPQNLGSGVTDAVRACHTHADEWRGEVMAALEIHMQEGRFRNDMRALARRHGRDYLDVLTVKVAIRKEMDRACEICGTAYFLYCVSKLLPRSMVDALDELAAIGIGDAKRYIALVGALPAARNGETDRILRGIGRLAGAEAVEQLCRERGIPRPQPESGKTASQADARPAPRPAGAQQLTRRQVLQTLKEELDGTVTPEFIEECVRHRIQKPQVITQLWALETGMFVPRDFLFARAGGMSPERIYDEYRKSLGLRPLRIPS